MSSGLKARLEDLKERFGRLSARERVAVGALFSVFALLIIGGSVLWVASEIADLQERNEAIRTALRDMQRFGGHYLQYKKRQNAIKRALSATPLDLAVHADSVASAVGTKIEVTSSAKTVDGSKHRRIDVKLTLRKITLAQLVALMTRLSESATQLVHVRELNVQPRWGSREELDVDMVISTYTMRPKKSKSKTRSRQRSRG